MKAIIEIVIKRADSFIWNKETEFGMKLSQLPVNNLFEQIYSEVLKMVNQEIKVTKTALLSRLTKEQKSFINKYSK